MCVNGGFRIDLIYKYMYIWTESPGTVLGIPWQVQGSSQRYAHVYKIKTDLYIVIVG